MVAHCFQLVHLLTPHCMILKNYLTFFCENKKKKKKESIYIETNPLLFFKFFSKIVSIYGFHFWQLLYIIRPRHQLVFCIGYDRILNILFDNKKFYLTIKNFISWVNWNSHFFFTILIVMQFKFLYKLMGYDMETTRGFPILLM